MQITVSAYLCWHIADVISGLLPSKAQGYSCISHHNYSHSSMSHSPLLKLIKPEFGSVLRPLFWLAITLAISLGSLQLQICIGAFFSSYNTLEVEIRINLLEFH